MKHLERLNRSIRATGKRYAKGEITLDQMLAARERVDRLRSRVAWVEQRNRRRARWSSIRRAVERVRVCIAEGGRMIAYDTEYVNDGPVQQMGITVWDNHVMTTTTYTTPHFDRAVIVPSLHGAGEVRTSEEMREIAQALYQRDAIQVFHAADVEFQKLGLDKTAAYYVDTARLGHMFYANAHVPGLDKLCQRYAIIPVGHHNAGNDSRLTMEVLVRLATDPAWNTPETRSGEWSDRINAIEKFAPTRLPPLTPEEIRSRRKALLLTMRSEVPTSILPDRSPA